MADIRIEKHGDFWEAFGDSAEAMAESMDGNTRRLPDGRINFGVPYHNIWSVIPYLVDRKGHTVTLVP